MITFDLIGSFSFLVVRLYALQPQKFRESGELIESATKMCILVVDALGPLPHPCNSA